MDRLDDALDANVITVEHAWRAWLEYVPSALAQALQRFCPHADAAIFEAGVRRALEAVAQPVLDLAAEHLREVFNALGNIPGIFQLMVSIFGGGDTVRRWIMEAVLSGTGPAAFWVTFRLPADSPIRPVAKTGAEITAAKTAATAALQPVFGDLVNAAFAPGIARFNERLAKWGTVTLLADPDPAIAAAGFVVMQRELPPESSLFHLYPATDVAARSLATATPAELPPERTGNAIQYRPFENHGLAGQLLMSLSAVDPVTATGLTSDLLGTPAELTPQLPPLTDIILEITFRACHDAQLAATVRGNRGQRKSALAVATATARDVPGLLPSSGRGSRTRTVHFSLRAHRDQTLTAWLLARTKGLPVETTVWDPLPLTDVHKTPLGPFDGFKPLTGPDSGLRTVTLRLLPQETFSLPTSNIAQLENVLTIPLADLGVPAIDTQRDVAFQQISIAFIPFVATGGTIPASLGTVGYGTGLTTLAPTLPMNYRLAMPRTIPTTPTTVLASTLPSAGGDVTVTIPDLSKIYDVLFSITCALPSSLVDATAAGVA
jgi:hypothetical protein